MASSGTNKTLLISLIVVVILAICFVCLLLFGGAGLYFYTLRSLSPLAPAVGARAPQTPKVVRPTSLPLVIPTLPPSGVDRTIPAPILVLPTSTAEESPLIFPVQVSTTTLSLLQNTSVPENDLVELARRFKGVTDTPERLPPPAQPYQIGDQKYFWINNTDDAHHFQVTATLEYRTEHAYFWIEQGIRFNRDDLSYLAETFEQQIYPTTRIFFGSELTPGIDGDPRLYVLYAKSLGRNLAGYFSSIDSVPPQVHQYSNAVEMILLSADNVDLGEQFAYEVLAHEFQHMIHWVRDRNEETWMNEGFSEVAALLNGLYSGGFDRIYLADPDIQLNYWPDSGGSTSEHYGAAFLFLSYFWDRFGDQLTQTLVNHPANGLESIDRVLDDAAAVDPLSGLPVRADEVFLDWVITSFINDESTSDGRYAYIHYPDAPTAEATETIRICPFAKKVRAVNQYAVDYLRITCSGNYTINFDGSIQTEVVPTDAHSGQFTLWSNRGDESHMVLSRDFDFTQANGSLTLQYWTWYDLEEEYDYLYLTASEDGEHWEIIRTPGATDHDPSGNNYGWGYNGQSGGNGVPTWIQEQIDLTRFAGKRIQIRFEYITDAAVNLNGFLLDDVGIPEIGYFTDFEEDDGGWQAQGWVRMDNTLPQNWRLALISQGNNSKKIDYISLSPDLSADIPVEIGKEYSEIILVVTATTRFTTQPTAYQFSLRRNP